MYNSNSERPPNCRGYPYPHPQPYPVGLQGLVGYSLNSGNPCEQQNLWHRYLAMASDHFTVTSPSGVDPVAIIESHEGQAEVTGHMSEAGV